MSSKMNRAEELARKFHEKYESLAPMFDYKTRRVSRVPWSKVPIKNKRLMVAVCEALLKEGVMR